jgi:predicted transcriptional regulator
MAKKTKTRHVTVVDEKGTFSTFFKKLSGEKKDYDFAGLSSLRNLLSNEKSRILHVIKTKSPRSIYSLSKILKRDFKSVNEDVKTLEKFGFLDLIAEKTGKRERLKPVIVVDSINIEIKV